MTSKSGGHDAGRQGHQDHKILKGRALSASHIKSTEKFAEREAGRGHSKDGSGTNKQRVEPKKCDIPFETNSTGGRGGLLKQLQEKCIAEKLAKNVADENNNGGIESDQISRSAVNSISGAHRSKLPISNGGCGVQKDSKKIEFISELYF